MPRFLNTRGRPTLALAVCDRCRMKRRLNEIVADGNSPGLRVCIYGCRDVLDPWRLPARQTERITLRNPRLEEPIPAISFGLLTERGERIVTET